MNPSSPQFDPAAEDQAALWAARIEGATLTAADREALDAWLAKESHHRVLLSHYCQFSADLEVELPELVAAGAVTMPSSRRRSRRPSWAVAGLAAASLAAAALVAFTLRPTTPAEFSFAPVATSVGKRTTVNLPDGTQVDLNAQTSLTVEASNGERRVRLGGGEAYFSVSKDPARPFIVETPAGSVRVTGTKFNVQTETTSAFDVTVVEGSVQVRPSESTTSLPISMSAGDHLSVRPSVTSLHPASPAELEQVLAWRQGQIVFEGVPLREALARFARYHGRAIVAAPDTADLRVGGRFSLDDLDGFFSALEEVLPVQVTRDLSGAIRVNRRSHGNAKTTTAN